MKSRRFQHEYRKNASKGHRAVGEILRNVAPWSGYLAYQEYPVNKVDPTYPSGREHYDWYVQGLGVVVEIHGRQHYEPVAFGSEDATETIRRFREQQRRDDSKRQAALDAGAVYVVIRFDEEVTPELLWLKYQEAVEVTNEHQEHLRRTKPEQETESEDSPGPNEEPRVWSRSVQRRTKIVDPEYDRQQKERAREWRRRRYRRAKELKKKADK